MYRLHQKDAVYHQVLHVLAKHNIPYSPHNCVQLTHLHLDEVADVLTKAVYDGHVYIADHVWCDLQNDVVAMTTYIRSIVKHWLRKDIRLNGGVPCTPSVNAIQSGKQDRDERPDDDITVGTLLAIGLL